MPGAVIGERCSLGQNVVVMNGTRIGDNCKIQNNVSIYEGVELEDDVFCGPSMVFTNVINPRSHVSRKNEYRRTLVRRGAVDRRERDHRLRRDARRVFVHRRRRGRHAGRSPTTRSMVGVPARRIGWMCQCGERLPDSGDGRVRGMRHEYERVGDGIRRARNR